jgi:hypothetical protein
LENITDIKEGQIAHLDQDRNNNSTDNLAFLCLKHHDEYDTQPSQSKGFMLPEVKRYRNMLTKEVEKITTGTISNLQVHAYPILQGRLRRIMFRVDNSGNEPVKINSVVIGYSGNRSEETVSQGINPGEHVIITLNPGNECTFYATPNCSDFQEIIKIGVLEKNRKAWLISDLQLAVFKEQAKKAIFPEHLLDDEDRIPETVADQKIDVSIYTEKSHNCLYETLCIQIENQGNVPIPVFSLDIHWDYTDAHLPQAQETGTPRVVETGGGMTIPGFGISDPIFPNSKRIYKVEDEWAPVLVAAAGLNVDPKKIRLKIKTSRTQGWTITEQGLPESIRLVAKSVVKSQIRKHN